MKETTNVKFVTIPVTEIDSLNTFEFQRLTDKNISAERIKELGFTEDDVRRLALRVKKYKKSFAEQGTWLDCAPMSIYCIDGKNYVVDGAGRLCALKEMMADCVKNGQFCPIREIPAIIYYNKDSEDLAKDTQAVNLYNVNWTPDEILRSKAMREGGDAKENYIMLQEIRSELNTSVASHIPRMIMYGYEATRKESLSRKADVRQKNCDAFRTFFRTFYRIIDKRYTDSDGIENKPCTRLYRRSDISLALYSTATHVFDECEKRVADPGIAAIQLGKELAGAFLDYSYGEKPCKKNNFNSMFYYQNGGTDARSKMFKRIIGQLLDEGYIDDRNESIAVGIKSMLNNMTKARKHKPAA